MALGDYSQSGDPYGITEEYTAQSATTETTKGRAALGVDLRGNRLAVPSSIPTQEEADFHRFGSK